MRTNRLILPVISVLLVLACNFPSLAPQSPAPSAPTAAFPSPAPQPVFTLAPTLPALGPRLTPLSSPVNCRSGPDIGFDAVDVIAPGQSADIIGHNEDSSWLYVRDPNNPSVMCWVAASVVTVTGSLAGVPFVAGPAAPPQPSSGVVTKVTVGVDMGGGVCPGPMTVNFYGTITTNGPTKVLYQWEITGDAENTTSPQSLSFKKADSKDAQDPGAYKTHCGSFTITLHVTSPNNISAKKHFNIP